jgi:hypothetical protein
MERPCAGGRAQVCSEARHGLVGLPQRVRSQGPIPSAATPFLPHLPLTGAARRAEIGGLDWEKDL